MNAMERSGGFMSLSDAAHKGKTMWCDHEGSYTVEGESGSGPFYFHRNGLSAGGDQFLRCEKWRPRDGYCPVTSKVSLPDGGIEYVRGVHNHPPRFEGYGPVVRRARNRWLESLQENPQSSASSAVLGARRRMPMGAAVTVIPVQHYRTAHRYRTLGRPRKVANLDELYEAIQDLDVAEFTRTLDGHRLLSFRTRIHNSLLITTRRQLDLAASATVLHADATYKAVPRGFGSQLFTIHGSWGGRVGMLAFAFMTSSTSEAYAEIFGILKQEVPLLNPPAYMGDFDKAMRRAVREKFPDTRILGCLFHFAQRLVLHVSEPAVGLATDIRQPGEVQKKFMAFTALPLLPPDDIIPVFNICADEALGVSPQFQRFIEYFRRQWLQEIGPADLSLYRAECRTNNAVEASNAYLNRNTKAHGAIWDLMSVLVAVCQDTAIDKAIRDRGEFRIRSVPNASTLANERKIQENWDLLDLGLTTPKAFVNVIKYRVGGSLLRGGQVDDEATAATAQATSSGIEDRIAEDQIEVLDEETFRRAVENGYIMYI